MAGAMEQAEQDRRRPRRVSLGATGRARVAQTATPTNIPPAPAVGRRRRPDATDRRLCASLPTADSHRPSSSPPRFAPQQLLLRMKVK